jgi:AMP-binding enzyme C-terminal domain
MYYYVGLITSTAWQPSGLNSACWLNDSSSASINFCVLCDCCCVSKVAPAEIERVLLLHPDVTDAAVVAVKDNAVGDLPRAYVVVKRTSNASPEDVIKFVNGNEFIWKTGSSREILF